MSLFVTWIIPVLIIAIVSRFGVDTLPPAVKIDTTRPISIDTHNLAKTPPKKKENKAGMTKKKKKSSTPSSAPSVNHPTSYRRLLDDLNSRKRLWKPTKASSSSSSSSPRGSKNSDKPPTKTTNQQASSSPSQPPAQSNRGTNDPQRLQLEKTIERRRAKYETEATVQNAIDLADALRHKDLKYHDGGMGQQEGLNAYQFAIDETLIKRRAMQINDEATNVSLSGTQSVPEELMVDYSQKSVDGLLCALYSNMGKLYFMANMFERAVESYSQCVDIEPLYLDAVGSRGSSEIILGQYEEAGKDFTTVLEHDVNRLFNDAFTGISKVLVVKEEVVPGGWTPMINILEPLIQDIETKLSSMGDDPNAMHVYTDALNRLHHVLFTYHDAKTKNREEAWRHLTQGYKNKMATVQPYNYAQEEQKLLTTKTVFHQNFWPDGIGSSTNVPIFIIGFVRSGSTLLERVLDAHPSIVGTGEDSVFNGRLDQIRNEIVKSSLSGNAEDLKIVVQEMADAVTNDMRERWKTIDANTEPQDGSTTRVEPQRFADKMLTNYFNVGFIHMLFPNALILHVARNPMDVLWSAYKHEFPAGGLDYTSEFESLANMYHSYREIIKHWDAALPGRITHVRYEDLVHDMPGMARAIIGATGLPWDDTVLEFHKKKQAVNTLSTTQVRQGIYKHSLEAWKKYETQLQPLGKLVGKEVKWDLKTTLPNYIRPTRVGVDEQI